MCQLSHVASAFTVQCSRHPGDLDRRTTGRRTMLRISRLASHLPPRHSASPAVTVVSSTSAGKQFSEVAEALSKYFDGAHNVEPELTRSIWHPEVAQLKGVDSDGEIIVVEPSKYLENIAAGAAGSTDEVVLAADKIVSLEFTSTRTVLARVEVADPLDADGSATIYTDFISMVDITGRGWTVVSKVFAGRPLGSLSYSEPNMASTHSDIVAQLQHYFDGQRPGAGSSTIMRKVFHTTAYLRGPVMECDQADFPQSRVGDLRILTATEFFDMLDDPDFPTWEDKGLNKILKVDKSGPRSACATVQIQFGEYLFTDHLSLLLLGNESTGEAKWMIVHKTFVPSAI